MRPSRATERHRRLAIAVTSLALAACGDAITLTIQSDLPVPTGIDRICVAIADTAATGGGAFGRPYRLEGTLASLPQTLRIEPGSADAAYAWVRADRGGVPVARAAARVDFDDDVALDLARCQRGVGGAPAQRGAPLGPPDARLASSQGPDGHVVAAVAAGVATLLDARDGALVEHELPQPPSGAIRDVIALDLDGDCDDDLAIVSDAVAPTLWRRDGATTFSQLGTIGDAAVTALAAADVDRDGAFDVVTGDGSTLTLWRNDGTGSFARDADSLAGGGRVRSVQSLALGDLDGDGNPDLVVGQAGDPLVAWLGDPGGTGRFAASPAAVPAVPLDARALALADADGDLDPDLVVAVAGAPLRLYIARDGRLEDQSFVRLPDAPSDARAIAIGAWDASCEPDALIASASTSLALHGQPTGALDRAAELAAATDLVLTDLDDDGIPDALLVTPEGTRWVAR